MRKIIINSSIFLLGFLATCFGALAKSEKYEVSENDAPYGYFVKRIWLANYQMPRISLTGLAFAENATLPAKASAGDPQKFTALLGMEQKKPFVVVRIPAFVKSGEKYKRLAECTIDVVESDTANTLPLQKTTGDVTNSVLANGTWYKIGTTQTGFYKIDFNFFKSMGIAAGAITPANIRVFGNGGRMLSEDNAVSRPVDLTENAIIVNDGGDNVFNDGDYAVFYALGTTAWTTDTVNKTFFHTKNLYSDTTYYYVTVDNGPGRRVQLQTSAPTANISSSGFDYYDVHELDLVSPATVSKSWIGEQFYAEAMNTSQAFSFNLGDIISQLTCKISFGLTQQEKGSILGVTLNGNPIGSTTVNNLTLGDIIMTHIYPQHTGACNSNVATIGLNFTPSPNYAAAHGYLDYIEISGRRALSVTGNQINFRDWQTVGSGKIAGYTMAGANSSTRIWDVTDPYNPVQMQGNFSGSNYSFSREAGTLHEFAAMNNANLYVPKYISPVSNQNLHSFGPADLIIVSYPDFLDAAARIADYHKAHDHMRVAIVTTTQVFNEFSSGMPDVCAVRDFARMFYKRGSASANTLPKYLMMMGTGSYDYKNRLPSNCNFVPTFEAANDSNNLYSFLSDDFFGFLDDSENSENNSVINALDIGVGRIPARTVADANAAATKIINYSAPQTLGPWRLNSLFVADDNDNAGDHMDDAETMARQVSTSGQFLYNEMKIYLNAIPVISTPAGPRCPNANAALNEQIYKGAFMVNYNGHGNPEVWTSERILTSDDFNNWSNANMLPFMVTATCDFGQFDHPLPSAAEQLMLREGGGAISMLTTTGAVFSGYNTPMNKNFLSAQFTRNTDGSWNTFGDACRIAKNSVYTTSHYYDEIANYRKFVLLGDPALTPDFPKYNIKVDSVQDGITLLATDSIKALGKYVISGRILDNSSLLLSDFNGTLSMSFFDKARSTTIVAYNNARHTFTLQDNLIYKGKVSVKNGKFSIVFIVPKDINYFNGKGKISTYAENGSYDAAGADTSLVVGSFSDHPVENNEPPVVNAYINDSFFIDGGITGNNTSLFIKIRTVTGVNVTGFGIGHDLTAVLDGNKEQPYILNDYYETAPNTYQLGFVKFPVAGLHDGKHTVTVTAWDVNNNEGEGSVNFEVLDGKIVAIENLGNYPNPFSTLTHFTFEHNHPDEQVTATIYIYNAAGQLARTLKESFITSSSHSSEITWDGTDNMGGHLPSGIYIYKLNIETEKGFRSTAYQKLVIVR